MAYTLQSTAVYQHPKVDGITFKHMVTRETGGEMQTLYIPRLPLNPHLQSYKKTIFRAQYYTVAMESKNYYSLSNSGPSSVVSLPSSSHINIASKVDCVRG